MCKQMTAKGRQSIIKHVSLLGIIVFFVLLVLSHPCISKSLSSNHIAEIEKACQQDAFRSKSGAVILKKEETVAINPDGTSTRTIIVVGQVFDDEAASDYSQIGIFFDSFYETIKLEHARTIHPDGKIIQVSEDATQLKTISQDYGIVSYSNTQLLAFTLPDLKAEACFEFTITITGSSAIPGHWFGKFFLHFVLFNPSKPEKIRIDPVLNTCLALETSQRELFFDLNKIKADLEKEKNNGRISYKFEKKHLSGIVTEPNMPPIYKILPYVLGSTIPDWSVVDHCVHEKFAPKIKPSEQIQELAVNLTKDIQRKTEKILKIAQYVNSTIKYVYANLNRDTYEPHSNSEILRRKYGDCKDQTVLVVSMLNAIGVKSFPAFINPKPGAEMKMGVPHMIFRHVITYIPDSEGDMFIDTTPDSLRFPGIDWANQGRHVYISNGDGGKHLQTPKSSPDDNVCRLMETLDFKDSSIQPVFEIELSGLFEIYFKTILKDMDLQNQKSWLLNSFGLLDKADNLTELSISGLETGREPFKAIFTFDYDYQAETLPQVFTYENNFLVFDVFFSELGSWLSNESRSNDIDLKFKRKLIYERLCRPPNAGFIPMAVPGSQSIKTPYFSSYRTMTRDNDLIRLKSTFILEESLIPQKHFKTAVSDIKKIIDRWKWKLIYQNENKEDNLAVFLAALENDPENITNIIVLVRYYLGNGQYADAVPLLKRAVNLAPDNGEVYYCLGLAQGYLDRFKESRRNFDKAKQLGYRP